MGIDPRLSQVAKMGLGVLGVSALVTSRLFKAKQTALFMLASTGLMWVGLRWYGLFLPPDYVRVQKYALTEADVQGWIEEAKRDEFATFEAFLSRLNEGFVFDLKAAGFFRVINPLLIQAVSAGKISDEVNRKIYFLLKEQGVFAASDFRADIQLVSTEGTRFSCNRTLFMLLSPVFKKMMQNGFSEAVTGRVVFKDLTADEVAALADFLSASEKAG